jgi:hypothetical protein
MLVSRNRRALLAGIAVLAPLPAAAQKSPDATDPSVGPAPVAATTGSKRVFTAADFTRFAPKTAYDMVVQVPGFTIRSADQERGLGQASENVLINGQRIANKSGGATDELQKINAANVERIEIVEAASLGIAGLSGQVANVLIKAGTKSSGQFQWQPDIRAHFAKPNLFRGLISYAGKTGPVDYTVSLQNETGRGGFGGTIQIYDAQGVNFESRDQDYHSEFEHPKLTTKFALDGPGSSQGNLTLAYGPYWGPVHIRDRRVRLDLDHRTRETREKLKGYTIDISGDYAFALGPGRLKVIGLRKFDHEPLVVTQVTAFDSGALDEGIRFSRDSRIGETIVRSEYGWKSGKNDWQISVERAFNTLDQRGTLSE